jgi:hypothetical protein
MVALTNFVVNGEPRIFCGIREVDDVPQNVPIGCEMVEIGGDS